MDQEELKKYIEKMLNENKFESLEDIQQNIDGIMLERNNQGLSDFEGYSPSEMTLILYSPLYLDSPIKLQKLSDSEYQLIPILNLVKYLIDLIQKVGEIKLTDKGFLPTKIVKELYNQGFYKEYYFEMGFSRLYKESDSLTINLTRILLEISGITKKRKGKLSLTKSGEKIISQNNRLLTTILGTFVNDFNWAFFDRFQSDQIGQFGWGFSIILLSKYGNEKRLDSFYSQKYFKAFPRLLETIKPNFGTVQSYSNNCYSVRTFDRFLDLFGLIKIEEDKNSYNSKKYITKTDLFDKLIKILPHNSVKIILN